MRFMVIVKADENSEASMMPDPKIFEAMANYNEQLVKAGVMLAGDGLNTSKEGVRLAFDGAKRTVTDGAFAETKELVAGFWIWQWKPKEEASEWPKRAPFDGGTEIELRPIAELEDFGDELTPEVREKEKQLAAELEARKASR